MKDETTIKHFHDYKYLGINIFKDGTLDEAIKERSTLRRKMFTLLNIY